MKCSVFVFSSQMIRALSLAMATRAPPAITGAQALVGRGSTTTRAAARAASRSEERYLMWGPPGTGFDSYEERYARGPRGAQRILNKPSNDPAKGDDHLGQR